jgi:hypothetical protein
MDFKLDENGDLVIGANGDFVMVDGDESIAQTVVVRLKTFLGDCMVQPYLGASLESFIGRDNSQAVRDQIEDAVRQAVTKDNLVVNPYIKCIPLGENEVFVLLEFSSNFNDNRKIQVSGSLDLKIGEVFNNLQYNIL